MNGIVYFTNVHTYKYKGVLTQNLLPTLRLSCVTVKFTMCLFEGLLN